MAVFVKEIMNHKLSLFATGILQTMFVAMNIVFITKEMIIPMFITGLCISLIWSWNITKIAFSTWSDRFSYAFGAATGGIIGFYLSYILLKFL